MVADPDLSRPDLLLRIEQCRAQVGRSGSRSPSWPRRLPRSSWRSRGCMRASLPRVGRWPLRPPSMPSGSGVRGQGAGRGGAPAQVGAGWESLTGSQLGLEVTKGNGSSWIFEPCPTWANALQRVQHPAFALVRTPGHDLFCVREFRPVEMTCGALRRGQLACGVG
jgi:hypothetical protein